MKINQIILSTILMLHCWTFSVFASSFSQTILKKQQHLIDAMINLPFNHGVLSGTLPSEIFQRYIQQDKIYITAYKKSMQNLLSKIPSKKHQQILKLLTGLSADDLVHARYSIESVSVKDVVPITHHYMLFLENTTSLDYKFGIASILPCFMVYEQVAKKMLQHKDLKVKNNAYYFWIDKYSSDKYSQSVEKMMRLADEIYILANPKERQMMIDLCETAVRLEYMFWKQIFDNDTWPK